MIDSDSQVFMSRLATYEGVVENGHVTLPAEADIPEKTRVYIVVPDFNSLEVRNEVPTESFDEDEISDITPQQIYDDWLRGKSPSQIAKDTGLPIEAVYHRLKRHRKAYIASPRLTNPEQAKDFELQVIEEPPHADV